MKKVKINTKKMIRVLERKLALSWGRPKPKRPTPTCAGLRG
ncbi:MAG: hypothetical protein V2A53_07980 [bacterium]